jgi:hypothetical protein
VIPATHIAALCCRLSIVPCKAYALGGEFHNAVATVHLISKYYDHVRMPDGCATHPPDALYLLTK